MTMPENHQSPRGQTIDQRGIPPVWDKANHRLFVERRLIKHFHRDAPLQFRILDAFQDQGWPPSIANPLRSFREPYGHKALRNAVANLNRSLNDKRLFFFTMERDRYVGWRSVASTGQISANPS